MTDTALCGLRVLDLSRVLAGPWCTQTLADLGADVVKVERPGCGDDTRQWGPPWAADGMSAYFLSTNRNKRSIAVDPAEPADQALVRRLASVADVVVENFKVGGLAQYGLDYASLAPANPRLIYASITGFGQTGPYRDRPGYDFMIQATGGLMSITGQPDSAPGGGPVKVGVAVTDVMSGMYTSVAILAALQRRATSGRGQYIDMALMDVQVAMLANQAANFLVGGTVPGRLGNAHPNIVPYQEFPTADGYLIIAVGNDRQFAQLADVMGRPQWASDERFARNPDRVQHRDELTSEMAAITRTRPTGAWLEMLERANVPCGPINTIERVFADPQVQARALRFDLRADGGEAIPQVASPIRLSESPVRYVRVPPGLGQHTAEVVNEWLGDHEKDISLQAPKT